MRELGPAPKITVKHITRDEMSGRELQILSQGRVEFLTVLMEALLAHLDAGMETVPLAGLLTALSEQWDDEVGVLNFCGIAAEFEAGDDDA